MRLLSAADPTLAGRIIAVYTQSHNMLPVARRQPCDTAGGGSGAETVCVCVCCSSEDGAILLKLIWIKAGVFLLPV